MRGRTIGAVAALVAVAISLTACSSQPRSAHSPHVAVGRAADAVLGAPAGVGDQSYQLTSSDQSLPGLSHHDGQTAACADGWYVRAGGKSVWTATGPLNPQLTLSGNTPWVEYQSVTPVKLLTPHSYGPYQSFRPNFYNGSLKTHIIKFSWWCDKVTPWFNAGATLSSAVDPIPPTNPYGDRASQQITNAASGQAWDNTGARNTAGNPVGVYPVNGAHNQKWFAESQGYSAGVPAYAFWVDGMEVNWQAVENGSTKGVEIQHSNGAALPGAVWAWLDESGMGPTGYDLQLVNLTSWQCATAPEAGAGQITEQPCDTTDKAQWWNAAYVK